jgi:pimeloyl-ACP methyl ester carboxylesterase
LQPEEIQIDQGEPAGPAPVTSPAQSLADGSSRTASFGTNRIRYVTLGEGSHTLVFIHGWGCNLNFWREQAAAFADKARLIFIDLPGHGQSDKPNTAYTMNFLARAVVAVLRSAGVEKATLIAHSLGAAVACRVYAQVPEKVAALVSVDGLLGRPPGTAEQAKNFIAQFRTPEYRQHAEKFISDFFPYPGTEKLRDEVVAEVLATPQYVMAGAAEGMVGLDQPDWALEKVGVPVLVLNARSPLWNDRSRQYAESLSPQADYRIFDGVGHFLMLEKPAEFNANLAEMLRKFELIAP